LNSFGVGGNPGTFTVNRTATLLELAPNNLGSANIVLNSESTLTVDATVAGSGAANMGTLGNLNIGGGSLNFFGSTSTSNTLTVGTITLAAGSSTITTTPGTSGSV